MRAFEMELLGPNNGAWDRSSQPRHKEWIYIVTVEMVVLRNEWLEYSYIK